MWSWAQLASRTAAAEFQSSADMSHVTSRRGRAGEVQHQLADPFPPSRLG